MKKKLIVSVLSSLGIVAVAVGVAYASGTFKANQDGYRQGGESQATSIVIRVEAGMADPNSDFIPDDANFGGRGGDLSFSIKNTSNVPLRVTKIEQSTVGCATISCSTILSNKNTDGNFPQQLGIGSCAASAFLALPTSFNNWPTIAPHSTLQVNGTDNNHLGAGMIHLQSTTPSNCQGATFIAELNVTALEAVGPANYFINP